MKALSYIIITATLSLVFSPRGMCEPAQNNRSDQFFEKGYVTSGRSDRDISRQSEETDSISTKDDKSPSIKEQPSNENNPIFDKFNSEEKSDEEITEAETVPDDGTDPDSRVENLPIKSVGLIVNSYKPEHAFKYIKRLSELALKRKLKVNKIFLVGNSYKELRNAGAFKDISDQFPLIMPRKAIPSEYEVKRSPTWIFATDNGEILVEGLENPFTIVTNDGKLKGNLE